MDVRQQLVSDAVEMLARLESRSITQAPSVKTLDTVAYTDSAIFQQECQHIFRKIPLMLAASCELPAVGDYKTMEVAGIPILLTRGKDGQVRAFLNACTHRGSKLAHDCGHAARFTCPYHAWTFGLDGSLISVAARKAFGDVDAEASALIEFPTTERAGLIWAILDPAASPEFDTFLSGIDKLLEGFNFANWHYFESRSLSGANWKLAFDAHLDFYHLPVLHRNTFGNKISNLAEYFYYGPHQRLGLVSTDEHVLEQDDLASLAHQPQEEWPLDTLLFGEWIIFPNVSINCFYKGGRGVIISQIFPGRTAEESITVQMFLHEKKPEGELLHDARAMSDFLGHVVSEEDLPMSRDQQQVFASGLLPKVQLGRNEGGVQHFHHWLDLFVNAPARASLAEIMKG
ncbi:aromatic ring-hydroxylating oxygenase subunit alpha [Aquisediminimonas sediminicola]|uniref:aromatic ring-hydroxylating oxygenase subunit alpha n=1 Tax=Alteraquisediminimonas sediminicola TaxID=2676787 RepID=UPI001C8E29EF|nr:aromatic ring-hydroxylating dioxygenase subunit alpha [Aquisediminimonas sediminicola]